MTLIRRILLLCAIACLSCVAIARDEWKDVSRIVAIGDLHGDYEQFSRVMEMAGLIDEKGDWIGGHTHLVQIGDIPDRAPDTLKIIHDFQKLEKQARRAGGYIHLLIGNHEAMNIYGDLRYVVPAQYAVLVDSLSKQRQQRYYQAFVQALAESNPDMTFDEAFREKWEKEYPPGYVEYRLLWEPGGDISDWVVRHNTVIKINDVLFVHGGIDPHLPYMPLKDINRRIRKELRKLPLPADALAESETGPLWYRGLLRNPPDTEEPAVVEMLHHYDADHIVVGHTTTRGAVRPRFGDKVIGIDVGLSRAYGSKLACLVIEDGHFYALHRGHRVPIPGNDEGIAEYFRAVGRIDPTIPAAEIIESLQQAGQASIGDVKDEPVDVGTPARQ